MGKMLWKMLQSSSNGNEWLVVMAAGQLNKGKTLLLDQKSKDRLAKLNLEAAKAVIQKSAFFLAAVYLRTGIDLLGEDRWKSNYDITLAITSTLAEITYSIGVHDECHLLVDEVLANSRSLGDSLRAQFTRIEYLGSEKQLSEALDQGFILLGKFGQYFPSKPNKVHVGVCILKTKRMLRGKTDDFLVSLPRCEDDSAIAVMKTLTLIASFCYVSGRKEHVALVGLRMMQMTLRYGLTDCSCHGFALYRAVVGLLGMIKDAYRFGRLALLLYDLFEVKQYEARTLVVVHSFLHHLRKPFHESLNPLFRAHQIGFEIGDIEYAMLAAVSCKFTLSKHVPFVMQIDLP
jgi:predicted ATPase